MVGLVWLHDIITLITMAVIRFNGIFLQRISFTSVLSFLLMQHT